MVRLPANDQPPLPPGYGGVMVSFSPDWRERFQPLPRWQRWFVPLPEFRVDRKRWQGAYPVTFLTVQAGRCQVRLTERTGLGELILVQARLDVSPGEWRRLTIGPRTIRPARYPAPLTVDERGVDVNTATRRNRRIAVFMLVAFVFMLVAFVGACLLALSSGPG